jgi:ubiquitin C-terminal hydrolase
LEFAKDFCNYIETVSPDGAAEINNVIQFPVENLDLSKYVKGYNPTSYVYDLFGVCNHMGGVSGGHYTAFVKNVAGQWIHFNDTSVELVRYNNILVSPMAYCFILSEKNNLT